MFFKNAGSGGATPGLDGSDDRVKMSMTSGRGPSETAGESFPRKLVVILLHLLPSGTGTVHRCLCFELQFALFTETNNNKKLRYREAHSASVVLSWCTL